MIDKLTAMYEELKDLIESELGKEDVRLSCDLTDKKLNACITEAAQTKMEVSSDKESYSRLLTTSALNCLDAGLSACVNKEDFKVSNIYKEAEFNLFLDDKGFWGIKSITIKCDKKKIKEEQMQKIKNCLMVFKQSCSQDWEKNAIEINLEMID